MDIRLFLILIFAVFLSPYPLFAQDAPPASTEQAAVSSGSAQTNNRPPVQRSQHFVRSGVAYDADEDMSGTITVQDPKSFFNPRTKQVTWWGEFKPFASWGPPELKAMWYDPSGRFVASQTFRGMECRLAKTTLPMAPYRPEEGRWQVDIYMDGRVIDRKPFVIFDAARDARDKAQTAQRQQNPEISSTDVSLES